MTVMCVVKELGSVSFFLFPRVVNILLTGSMSDMKNCR